MADQQTPVEVNEWSVSYAYGHWHWLWALAMEARPVASLLTGQALSSNHYSLVRSLLSTQQDGTFIKIFWYFTVFDFETILLQEFASQTTT